jgi:hypothetical protein
MINGVLTTHDLLEITGYGRVGDLRRALEDQGIQYFDGKGGSIWTTMQLVNAAKGLPGANDASHVPKFGGEIIP